MNYKLNADYARESDNMSSGIKTSGAYIGMFIVAKHIVASTGSIGVQFNFKSNDGNEAGYLNLYTKDSSGKDLAGIKQLYALMTCLKLREITQSNQIIEEYDYLSKGMKTSKLDVYPDLMGKPIGVILQSEEYLKKDGAVGIRMAIIRFFDAATTRTASEILNNTDPVNVDKVLENLKDKKLPPQQGTPRGMEATDNFNGDIPF